MLGTALPLRWLAVLTAVLACVPTALASGKDLAPTPPMGWNGWNAFGCDVSAALVEQTAKAMVRDGLAAAGYKYTNIDDCWMAGRSTDPRGKTIYSAAAGRDANGRLVPDPASFPNGIKAVADYVHALGLKLGIYESAGATTCQGGAGSYGHELQDARTFASWGVDYLKYDNCGTTAAERSTKADYVARYRAMGDALRRVSAETYHPIVYSVCDWGVFQPWSWSAKLANANLWRTTGDIHDRWGGTVSVFERNVLLSQHAHPGAWNDPDMLEVGNGRQTETEYRSQFSLWSMMAAPLIAGTDLRNASASTLAIYRNLGVISVDQDRLGAQATVSASDGTHWTLVKPLTNGDRAVLFLNRGSASAVMHASLTALGLIASPSRHPARHQAKAETRYEAHDLWSRRMIAVAGTLTVTVPAHGVAMLRLVAAKS